ncbi:hypothetical protein MPSEU_000798200 [Mayamaea pseudoterrestris]|nr:hypothetical protein MPSEU_000798200 [Mayamaea pseudoterrestris]
MEVRLFAFLALAGILSYARPTKGFSSLSVADNHVKKVVVGHHQRNLVIANARRRNRSCDDAEKATKSGNIPMLPPIGDTAFGLLPMVESSVVATDSAFVGAKFGLQYTCSKCETRNSHLVSRIAYKKGVVITTCKGCQSMHLIADNLGTAGNYRLEEWQTVHRVSEDQFKISMLYNSYDTTSGAIVGQDGKMALE